MFHTNHRGRGLRTVLSGLLITLLACAVALVTGTGAQAETKDEKTLTVAVSQEVDSLSPFLAVRRITTALGRLSYDFLTNYDPKTGKTIPALAESWTTSEDGLTWSATTPPPRSVSSVAR